MIRQTDSCTDLKICCFAISADEPEGIIDRWLENVSPADYITVLITKTNNPNFSYFKKKQELPEFKGKLTVEEKDIIPWRFDAARNESMKLIPKDADLLVCTDIDEVLLPEFWDDYRKCAFEHPNYKKIRYKYAGLGKRNESPGVACWYGKTAPNNGYGYWKYPCHEELRLRDGSGCEGEFDLDENKVYLLHLQNAARNRDSYPDLVKLRYEEEGSNDVYCFDRIVRECVACGAYDKGVSYGVYLYIKVKNNPDIIDGNEYFTHSLCNVIGICYKRLGLLDDAKYYYEKGLKENSRCRDCYINLAQLYAHSGEPQKCYEVLDKMNVNAIDRNDWKFYLYVWDDWKYCQIMADAKCWEGKYEEAFGYLTRALCSINTRGAVNDAEWDGFFDDYNFCANKIGAPNLSQYDILGGL